MVHKNYVQQDVAVYENGEWKNQPVYTEVESNNVSKDDLLCGLPKGDWMFLAFGILTLVCVGLFGCRVISAMS